MALGQEGVVVPHHIVTCTAVVVGRICDRPVVFESEERMIFSIIRVSTLRYFFTDSFPTVVDVIQGMNTC